METELPAPIGEGEVAQTLIRYIGERLGAVCVRGRVSGRDYYYYAGRPLFWVLDEDLPFFRQHVEFEVTSTRIVDPVERRAQEQAEQVAALRRQLEALQVPPLAAPKSRAGGRPPLSDELLLKALHLSTHGIQTWSNDEVAQEIYGDGYDNHRDPGNAISKVLKRAGERFPDHENDCRLCRADWFPARPRVSRAEVN